MQSLYEFSVERLAPNSKIYCHMYEYKHVLLKTLSIVQENSLEKKTIFQGEEF